MKITDKMVQAFDDKFKPSDIGGFMYDSLTMALAEFSVLYQIKKYILAKSLTEK